MKTYYVYQLVDPRNNKPFYIGKGTGNRAYQHTKFKDGNENTYKDRKIKSILKENLEIIVDLLYKDLTDENTAVTYTVVSLNQVPDVDVFSGDLLYIDNRTSVSHSEQQLVTLRTIIKL